MRKFEGMKKVLSVLLCAVMVLGYLPVPAFADEVPCSCTATCEAANEDCVRCAVDYAACGYTEEPKHEHTPKTTYAASTTEGMHTVTVTCETCSDLSESYDEEHTYTNGACVCGASEPSGKEDGPDKYIYPSCAHHTHNDECGGLLNACTHVCDTCVDEIQAMVNALPSMSEINAENRENVISQMKSIDAAKYLLSNNARDQIDWTKYAEAAVALTTPEGDFRFAVTKKYEAGDGPQATLTFVDVTTNEAATLISADGTAAVTSVQPVSNGAALEYYLPAGTYTVVETVDGEWNMTLTVDGEEQSGHTFTGMAGGYYTLLVGNNYLPKIIIGETEGGTVSATVNDVPDTTNAAKDDIVTLTVTTDTGYELDALTVVTYDENQPVELTEGNEANTYTFIMPDSRVTVTATFKHTHDDITFSAWESTDTLPNEGNYYLTENVNLTSAPTITGTLNLCLNGKTVSGQPITITGTVSVYDCGEDGTISHNESHTIENNGVLNLYGGTVKSTGKSCIRNVTTSSQTIIDGGTILGAASDSPAVQIDGGKLTFVNGTATHSEDSTLFYIKDLGKIDIQGGTFTTAGTALNIDGTGSVTGGTFKTGTTNPVNIKTNSKDPKQFLAGGTFVNGINVKGTTLKVILAEGYGYFQNNSIVAIGADATDITGGSVMVKPAAEYPVRVAGTQVTSANMNDVLGDGTVSYDPDTNTLTLDNANIQCDKTSTAAIQSNCAGNTLKIVGTGSNTISASSGSGIYANNGNIVISGNFASISGSSNGIYAENGTVTIATGASVGTIKGGSGAGIFGKNGVAISGGVTTIQGSAGINSQNGVTISAAVGTITGTSGSGIYANNGDVQINSATTISGTTNGIMAEKGSVSIGNADVKATGGTGSDVYGSTGVTIAESGTLRLSAKSSKNNITGGILYIGTKGYQWDTEDEAYYCLNDKHDWTYAASDTNSDNVMDTITASCVCDIPDGTVSLSASNSTYDGSTKAATDTKNDWNADDVVIQYQKQNGENWETATTTAPTDAGTYKASITLGNATVSAEYTISPKSLNTTGITAGLSDTVIFEGQPVPTVTVKDGNTTLTKDKDYTVTQTGSNGEFTLTITGIGNYKDNYGSTLTYLVVTLPDPDKVEPDDKDAIDAYDRYSKLNETYKDADLEKALKELHEALTDYKIIKGNKSSYTKGSNKTLSFTANGYFGKFTGVEVDGKLIDAKYYSAESGSTVITLKSSYLESLKTGKHTIQVNYTDGHTSGEDYFRVTINNGSPFTGDNMNLMLMGGVAMTSLLCMAAMILFFSRKKSK